MVAKMCLSGASLFLQQALEEEDTKGKGTDATVPFPFDIAAKLKFSKTLMPNAQSYLNHLKRHRFLL